MLELNKNTYVTLAEADEYISSHYLSSSVERENWDNLSEEDKEVLLINAADSFQNLKLRSKKKYSNQYLVFPRSNFTENDLINLKNAQVEEALSYTMNNSIYDAYSQGLKSESIDSISKTYNTELLSKKQIKSEKAQKLFGRWLNGYFKIC